MDRKRLEEELSTATTREKTREDIDAMKKRAITTARTYDEFKNLVACASLKPVTREDLAKKAATDLNKSVLGRSVAGGRLGHELDGRDRAVASAAAAAVASIKIETLRSPAEFEREWKKRASHSATARLGWLQSIGTKKLASLFRSEIDGALLSGIIECVGAAVRGVPVCGAAVHPATTSAESSGTVAASAASNAETAAHILLSLTGGSLFALTRDMLTREDREAVAALCGRLCDEAAAAAAAAAAGSALAAPLDTASITFITTGGAEAASDGAASASITIGGAAAASNGSAEIGHSGGDSVDSSGITLLWERLCNRFGVEVSRR